MPTATKKKSKVSLQPLGDRVVVCLFVNKLHAFVERFIVVDNRSLGDTE